MENNEHKLDFLQDILARYSEVRDSMLVDEFIKRELSASGAFSESEADETTRTIAATIAGNSQNHRNIKDYKKRGLSVAVWLRDTLDKATAKLSPKERDGVIVATKQALSKNNHELLDKMLEGADHGR